MTDTDDIRKSCQCEDWPKPCSYHEGWLDAADEIERLRAEQYGMSVPPQWVGENVETLAYQIAGAVSAVFMQRIPDLVFPDAEVKEAVESVLSSDPRLERGSHG